MQGAIFDMDGTMIDNMMVHHRAWQRKLNSLGIDWSIEEVKEKVHGVNEEILERLFGDRFSPEERKQISLEKEEAYREIFLPELTLIAGLDAFLNALQSAKIPMAIGTAAPPGNLNFVLDNLPIRPYFKSILHSKDVSKGKPDPEIYLKSAAALGLPPEACLVFEDSPTGVEAARRAGCPAVAVTTTHNEDEFRIFPNVVSCIKDFREIKASDFFPAF